MRGGKEAFVLIIEYDAYLQTKKLYNQVFVASLNYCNKSNNLSREMTVIEGNQ